MKVFKDSDGKIYLTKEEIPVIRRSDNSELLKELEDKIALNEAQYKELRLKQQAQYDYITKLKKERDWLYDNHNKSIYKSIEEIEMSTLKVLSILGYKHIVMPDVFLRERNYSFDKTPPGIRTDGGYGIIGEVHDKVIVYKRKPTYTSSIYKNGIRVKGRELKWIAEIRVKKNYGNYYCYYQIYLDENKIRLGEPGNPMKYDSIKSALSGLFYINRSLNYDETKQLILTEMTKQLLKGK